MAVWQVRDRRSSPSASVCMRLENIGQNREMKFHFMSIHMSECHTIDEVGQKIGRYIYNIEGFKDYCMCLCEGWLEKKEFKGFTDKMEMPIAIRNRENISPTRERFDRREQFLNA